MISMGVSVIIPMYNSQATVGRAIASVLQQTMPASEIIAVDDGSNDHSSEFVLRHYAGVRVIRHEVNRGAAYSRNVGIEASTKPLVAFLDADDLWYPHHLETLVSQCQELDNLGFVFSLAEGHRPPPNFRDPFKSLVIYGNYVTTSAVVAARSALLSVGMFRTDWLLAATVEDWDLWMRLAQNFAVSCIPVITVYKTPNKKGPSERDWNKFAQDLKRCFHSAVEGCSLPETDRTTGLIRLQLQLIRLAIRQRRWGELPLLFKGGLAHPLTMMRLIVGKHAP